MSRTKSRGALALSALALSLASFAACGGEGEITLSASGPKAARPDAGVPQGGSGGSSGKSGMSGASGSGGSSGKSGASGASGSAGSAGSGGDAGGGPVLRTVEQHSRFGNVQASDNLLWDGDFEWSGPFVTQYAWSRGSLGWSPAQAPDLAYGAACRSGLKCAVVTKSAGLVGMAVSPSTPTTHVRVWARLSDDSPCSKIKVSLGACFLAAGKPPAEPVSSSVEAGPDGWCKIEGEVATLSVSPCLFIANKAGSGGTTVTVDDAYVGPGAAQSAPSLPMSPEDAADIEALQTMMTERKIRPGPRPQRPPSGLAPVLRRAGGGR